MGITGKTWKTWDEFCVLAKERLGTRLDMQERIRTEVRQRCHQPDEPARAYITCLEALLMKLESPSETSCMIEVLYENIVTVESPVNTRCGAKKFGEPRRVTRRVSHEA